MAKKTQVPVIGGIRKVILPAANSGTTIAELGSGIVTLAQLKILLGVPASAGANPSGTIAPAGGAGAPAALIPGAGLGGGGSLIGPVPLYLLAPIPAFIFDDGDEGAQGFPGAQGINGTIGRDGTQGAAIYMAADAGEDAMPPIPGGIGPTGVAGAAGPGKPLGAQWVSVPFTGAISLPTNPVLNSYDSIGTIRSIRIYTEGGTGSLTINVWKAPAGTFPTVANDITGGANVVITGGTSYFDNTLSGWTTSVSADDAVLFTLAAVSGAFTGIWVFMDIS